MQGNALSFVKLLSYVKEPTNPMYLILMEDETSLAKEYISFANVFIENTEENIKKLIEENSNRKLMLDKLLNRITYDLDILNVIEDTTNMFHGCTNLIEFKGDFSSAKNTEFMFYDCENLMKFKGDFSSSEYTAYMFYDCKSLMEFNGDFSSAIYTSNMFYNCVNLKKFNGDFSSATHTNAMFANCTNLEKFNGNFSNAIHVTNMFKDCTNLESFRGDFSDAICYTASIFHGCTNLDAKSKILIKVCKYAR